MTTLTGWRKKNKLGKIDCLGLEMNKSENLIVLKMF